MRLISIDENDRMSPKGRISDGFVVECVGWRRMQFAALAHLKWHQSPVAVFRHLFDPDGLGGSQRKIRISSAWMR
jgi:hypothetical protein